MPANNQNRKEMKRILLYIIMVFAPLYIFAQTSGGQITRKKANTTTATAKKTHSSAISKKTNSGNRNSTSRTTSQRSTTGMTQAEKDRIIENLIANMVPVKGGTFTMGATSEQGSEAYNNEKPAHTVTLSSFSIGKYEVTREEWLAVMGSCPSSFNEAKRPVDYVSWDDCQEFIRKLNSMTGKQFRLPTEAEWEYAARGGNKRRVYKKYSGSNSLGNVAWYTDNSNGQAHDVGSKLPNELGLYDMSGNVWEWCQDWYGSYDSFSQTNPAGASTGSNRVLRGGSWSNYSGDCRVSCRSGNAPGNRGIYFGLRLAH